MVTAWRIGQRVRKLEIMGARYETAQCRLSEASLGRLGGPIYRAKAEIQQSLPCALKLITHIESVQSCLLAV